MAATSSEEDVSAEMHFAQRLAANEKKIRDRAMRKLRKWFEIKSSNCKDQFTEADFLKIWKGLHYCMWMQDKALVQEELADNIAQLVQVFGNFDASLLFVDVFFQTEAREWNGIDRWRLDKFMMLVRRILEQSLKLLQRHKWKKAKIESFIQIIRCRIMSVEEDRISDGLKIHFTDIYLDELEKIGAEVLTSQQVIHFLEPFSTFLPKTRNTVLLRRVVSRIFDAILQQSVDDAMEAAEKQLEKEDMNEEDKENDEDQADDEEDDDMPPRLEYDFGGIADRLFELGKDHDCINRNRTIIYKVVKKFRDLQEGILPSKPEDDFDPKKGYISRTEFSLAVHRLQSFEMSSIKKKGKKRKKSKNKNALEDESDQDDNGIIKKLKVDQSESAQNLTLVKKKNKIAKGDKEGAKKQTKKKNEMISSDENFTSVKEKTSDISTDSQSCVNVVKKKAKKRKGDQATDATDQNDVLTKSKKLSNKQESENSESSESQKKRRKNVTKKDGGVESKLDNDSEKHEKLQSDNSGSEKHQAKVNRKKNKIGLDTLELKHIHDLELTNSVPARNNKKTKSKSEVQNPGSENVSEETEIWVPNKKYKGKLKGKFEEQLKKLESSEENSNEKGDGEKSFAQFEKLTKTPSAFVRKSMAKINLSKSEPKKKSGKPVTFSTPDSNLTTNKKRVSFDMKKNQALDFKQSIIFSPDPFNPEKRPDQSILKTPELTPTNKKSKAVKGSAKKKTPTSVKRARAADFF